MKFRLVSVLAVLASALLAFALLDRGTPPAGDEVARPDVGGPASAPPAARTALTEGAAERRESSVEPDRAPVAPAPEPPAARADAGLGRGTVLLTVESGAVRTDASGSLTLALRGGTSKEPVEVEVREGRFTFDAALDFELASIRAGLLDGRAVASLQPFQAFRVGPGDDGVPELDLACIVRAPVVLEVRDAGTGELVDRVDVALGSSGDMHPGSNPRLVVDAAPAPIELTQSELERRGISWTSGRWRIGGPGYAWKDVAVNLAGGNNVVMLEPCGSLVVEVSGVGLNEGLHLFLATWDYETRLEVPLDKDSRFTLERWPTGRTSARIQRGSWTDSPKRLAETDGNVAPGETLTLALEVPAEAGAPTYELDLGLEVHVPAGWDLESLDLALELTESANGTSSTYGGTSAPLSGSTSGGAQVFRFEAGARPTGTWRARFPHTGWSTDVDHEVAGLRRIDHPALATVTLTVVDRGTGEPVPGADVSWSPGLSYDPGAGVDESSTEPGVFVMRAPAAPLDLQIWHDAYTWYMDSLEPPPGVSAQTIELLRPIGMSLQLMDGGANVTPTDWSWMPSLSPVGSDEPTPGLIWGQELGKQTLQVTEPGTYVLKLPDVPGYEPIPDREVDLREGEFFEVLVQLVRGS